VVGVNRLHEREAKDSYFLRLRPRFMPTYCIHVYHLTVEEANELRASLGLAPYRLPSPERKDGAKARP
jgi:hypothetical protein